MDLMARRRAIMGMPSGKDYTVSGNVVSISNALAKNAKSLIVSFSPKQSGSGDPSPSNVRPITGYNDIGAVRYGKNLLFCDQSTATTNDVTATRNADGSFSLSGTATANGNIALDAYKYLSDFGFFKAGETYTLSGGTSVSMALIFGVYGSGTDYRDNGTGKTMSFTAEQIATKRYRLLLTITNGTNYDGVKVYPQIQYGSTATSYEPYISPVTANVHVGGLKNKFDVDKLVNTADITVSNGVIAVTGNAKNTTKKLGELADLTVGETYTLTANNTGTANIIYLYGSGANVSWGFGTSKTITQAMLDALVFMYGGANATSQISDMMIRPSSVTDATYEPYSVFGGTVDLVSGECVVDRACMVFNGTQSVGLANWQANAESVGWLYALTITPNIVATSGVEEVPDIYADRLKTLHYGGNSGIYGTTDACISMVPGGGYWGIAMRMADTSLTTAAAINAWLSVNPVTVVYKLATPITYHLTPSQLAMLKGNNTVYSNEGSITLTYVGK